MPLLIALAAVLVVVLVLVLVFVKPFGKPKADPAVANVQAPPAVNTGVNDTFEQQASSTETLDETEVQYDNLDEALLAEGNSLDGLSDAEMVNVSDLSLNTSLPSEWLNVLLMGTDERHLSNSARADALIICSINRNSGEVKLSSIMRDLAVELDDIGKYSGTYRINAASYFGGPELAMRTINENFKMNIQYYVMVNFFGFQKIAERLGGRNGWN